MLLLMPSSIEVPMHLRSQNRINDCFIIIILLFFTVEDLEGCVGVVNQRSKMPVGPPLVPDRCRKQALKLEMCIAAHQVDPRNN